jgi:thiol:disulfide interchange protein DsbD
MVTSHVLKRIVFYVILLVASISHAFVSEVDEGHPFTLFFEDGTPLEVKDFEAQLDFIFQIPEKHKLYKKMVRVNLENPDVNSVLILPAGITQYDEFMGEETEIYHDQLVALLKMSFPKDFDFAQKLSGRIAYQGCSDKICFRSVTQNFEFELKSDTATQLNQIQKIKSEPVVKESILDLLKVGDLNLLLKRGLSMALFISLLAGVITGFTPCVLPIIPLTLTFIGVTKKEKISFRLKNLLIFVLGLVVMYTVLGVVSAVLGQAFGFVFQNSWFLAFLAFFFFIMGLWMLGILNLNVPSGLQKIIATAQPRGILKYFYAGLTIGFLAAPCVGPILGPLLVYIATSQNIFLGTILMFGYSLGLSVMFFILGFFSRDWVARFGEKSGWVKRIFGILLLVGSFYYFLIWFQPDLWTKSGSDDFFEKDLVVAMEKAKGNGKNVLVDFYADWCLPCHEWDDEVWQNKNIQLQVLKDFVPVKIDCTTETDACARAVQRYSVIGWPTILFLDRGQKELTDKRLVGRVMTAEEFLEYIKDVKSVEQ